MNLDVLLSSMSPDVYSRLRQAAETGKWPDGTALDENQKSVCLQAVMLYQAKVEQSNEHMTLGADGHIVHKSKREFRNELDGSLSTLTDIPNSQTIAKFKENDF